MLKISSNFPITAHGSDGVASTGKDDVVKIDNSIKKTSTNGVKAKQSGTTSATGKTDDSQASVSVNLSSQLQSLSSGSSVFDANKVEEIKAAIAGGQFQVDTEKVADGLINSAKDLIQKPRG